MRTGLVATLSVMYGIPLTAVSLIAAVVIAGVALALAGGRGTFSYRGWLLGSVLAGAGVSAMHYMGMYAMNLRASLSLDPGLVAASIVIALGASAAALWIAFNVTGHAHRLMAAMVMAVAVCSMHYVGMAAADFVCIASSPDASFTVGGIYLVLWVLGIVGLSISTMTWVLLGRAPDSSARQPVRAG